MTEFRVLVADKAKAQLYKLPSRRSALQALPCFINPAAQVPERALGSSRHAYQPKTPLKEHAEEVFVRQVGSALATDARVRGAAPIVLVAAPRLLGDYRRHLPSGVRNRIALEIKLDLARLPAAELNTRVREALAALPVSVTAGFRAPRRKPAA